MGIEPVPGLPDEIKKAADRQTLAVFVGAGVSRIIGCMGWDTLASNLVNLCYDKEYVSFRERQTLLDYSRRGDHRKTISICRHVFEGRRDAEAFYNALRLSLKADPNRLKRYPIYPELYRLRALFVTTNIDTHFDELFYDAAIVYEARDFAPERIDRTRLYHLHGTIRDRASLVLTVAEYLQRYSERPIVSFLEHLFERYHVLFVGYGLAEFELLEYLVTKLERGSKELRHFYLMPLFGDEDSILTFEQSYFKDLGIKVLAYRKDERGYDQLFEVISQWQKEINQVSSYLYDSYALIEELGAYYDPAAEERLFQLIRNDPPQENHFFKTASSPGWLIPAKERGYFAPDKNPQPVESGDSPGYYHIPYWNVLDYLERVASQPASQQDEADCTAIMDIIRSVSDYRDDEGERVDNYHTDQAFVKIMAGLPIEFLEVQDMERIGVYLRSRWRASDLVGAEIGKWLLPRLLSERAVPLAVRLLDMVLGYEMHERNGDQEFVSLMDNFWLNELLENNKPAIGARFPLEAGRIVLNRMEQVLSADERQFNVVRIPAVEDHPQNRFPTRYQNILVRAARDFLDSAADKEPKQARALLEDLLLRQHPIFPRIALHTISIQWPEYADLFWPLLESELSTSVSLKHELYELIKRNQLHLSEEELDSILDWIETREYWTRSDGFENEEDEQRHRAYQKLEWLTALKESGYQRAADEYERYLALAGAEPEHPGFSTWMGDVQVGSISPIEVSELLGKENAEIARYLIEYRDQGEWYGRPSREGLADAFKAAVTNDPQKFSADLSPFLELPPYYLYYLLWGFKDAWDAKRGFDWQAVLSFCLKLTETDSFWMGPSEKDLASPGWLVSQVADLVEAGTRDDSHAFTESLLPLAEELLVHLLDKAPSCMYEGYDLLTAVLNSPKGRALAAAINYSLRYARLRRDEDPARRWAPAVKEDFTRRLDRSFDDSLEFSVTLGEYLATLAWLDSDWVMEHIDEIFLGDDEKHWHAAIVGYLWPGTIRRDLYKLLRDNGHYSKALETAFEEPHIRERLIQHLTIAYLWSDEELEDATSLFTRLVTGWRPSDLREIIIYLWMQRGGLEAEQRGRVLSLWRFVFAYYHSKDELGDEEKGLASEFSKLAVYLDSINGEALEWLQFSACHLGTERDAWFLVEYLHNLVATSPHEVGLVYIEMLENDIYPTFDQAHITYIVETLYDKGEKELADRICNSYGSRGYGFLRDLFDQLRDAD